MSNLLLYYVHLIHVENDRLVAKGEKDMGEPEIRFILRTIAPKVVIDEYDALVEDIKAKQATL